MVIAAASTAGGFVTASAAVGVVFGAAIAILTLFERLTGLFGRWVQHQHEQADRDIDRLIRYHLGPNGDTPALWRRVARIERRVGIDDADNI